MKSKHNQQKFKQNLKFTFIMFPKIYSVNFMVQPLVTNFLMTVMFKYIFFILLKFCTKILLSAIKKR